MKKIETINLLVNVFAGVAAIGAGFAFLISLGWFWLVFPILPLLALIYYLACSTIHFLRAARSLKAYKTFLLLLTFIFDAIFFIFFFAGFGGINHCIDAFKYSNGFLDLLESILFLIYAFLIILSLFLEVILVLEKNVDIKEEKNIYSLFIKIMGILGICSICFTGIVNSYYYGYSVYNYLFLVLLGAFLAILIFNSFSKYRKSRLEFTVALSVLLIFYYLISICTYLVIIFDGLEKPALNLLIGSWVCSGILIPTIVAFNIVYLVKTRDKKEEIKQAS